MSNITTTDPFRFRISPEIEFTPPQLETLVSILDTFIAPLSQDQQDCLVSKLNSTHTEQEVRDFCKMSSSSLGSLECIKQFINRTVLPDKRQDLLKILSVLSTSAGTFALTGHFTQFKNLNLQQREQVFLNWKVSTLAPLRLLYKTFHSLTCNPTYARHVGMLGEAMHYNDLKSKSKVYENLPDRLPMLPFDQVVDDLKFDAIVIGSGAGGGVVASQLAQAGKSVLVIEKGSYYHESEFIFEESVGFTNLYETGGFSASHEGSISLLAGSVFGGGTTVNWCASLKLQHFVREEWAKQGLSHFTSPKFAKDLDRVFERIGATTEGIVHNKSNQVLIDGCKALGYHVDEIPQNTGGKPHKCEFCYCGCKAGIKNGTMNTWLRDAYLHNAKFLEKTKVIRVLTNNHRKAIGVEALVHYNRKVTIKADIVVVSAGSLQSPGVLLRSGLKNKNIGRHLKLHPCTMTFGFFDRPIRTYEGSIMTAVSNVVQDLENDGYGAKLEVPCLHPGSFSSVVPWRGAAAHKENMLKYDRCAPVLILARDKDSTGAVRYDSKENLIVDFNLSNRDRRSMLAGIDRALDILVAAGAREVQTGQFGVEPFSFQQGEESRIDHPRYVAWKQQVLDYGFPKEGAGVFCAHQMCSNRMGVSPKTSVVRPTGETWEVSNLYVADASVFPTASGVNPMVTNEAIALHIADCIINKNRANL